MAHRFAFASAMRYHHKVAAAAVATALTGTAKSSTSAEYDNRNSHNWSPMNHHHHQYHSTNHFNAPRPSYAPTPASAPSTYWDWTRRVTDQFWEVTKQRQKQQDERKTKAPNNNNVEQEQQQQQQQQEEPLFQGQCLQRQLHQPKVPYPAWDYNWDGRMTDATSLQGHKQGLAQSINNTQKTRHIILVRHGQYDETPDEDSKQRLTPLGRRQAVKTGKRLAAMAKGSMNFSDDTLNGPLAITKIRVSDMARAKETAAIIAREMQKEFKSSNSNSNSKNKQYKVKVEKPDPTLNEALPAPMIPLRPEAAWAAEEVDESKERVEEAFRKYFYRGGGGPQSQNDPKSNDNSKNNYKSETTKNSITSRLFHNIQRKKLTANGNDGVGESNNAVDTTATTTTTDHDNVDNTADTTTSEDDLDEFEIVVCHGNMIRYFFCRALQIPPEAWLRMSIYNCSMTYLTIRPNGTVTARMLGDIGHLDYEESTYSNLFGFKW